MGGHFNALARVSIVDFNENTVFDKFVDPGEEVTDWRTEVSGVRPEDVENASDFLSIQQEVASFIKGRMLIGHQIDSDLKVLCLTHPTHLVRDTATFRKLCPGAPLSLKILCEEFLGSRIQLGEHSSIEDARAAMV